MVTLSFVFFLILFIAIGVSSSIHRKHTTKDYLLANQSISPWLTALSSMATNNSGYAFIGIVGFAYRFGIHSLWLTVAWVLGDILVWAFVHKKVRGLSGETQALSVPELLGSKLSGKKSRTIIAVTGLITFVFLSVYAAAQLKAGGTALHSLFGWDIQTGAFNSNFKKRIT